VKVSQNDNIDFRRDTLKSCGASPAEIDELLFYNRNVFDFTPIDLPLKLPLADEPLISTWKRYSTEILQSNVFQYLKTRLPQLAFPVKEGISETEDYRSATRKGVPTDGLDGASGLAMSEPESLQLVIFQSLAGKIPLLITKNREDFVSLTRALSMKNEPAEVPPSMGASMIAGFNNWDRVRVLKNQWLDDNPLGNWSEEFKNIIPQ